MAAPLRRRMRLMVGLLVLVTGCQSYDFGGMGATGSTGSYGLAGSSWLVDEIDGRPVVEKTRSTLDFKEERVSGSAGCNLYSAPVFTQGSALQIGKAASTRIVCSPTAMGQELRFFTVLSAATGYRTEGDVLRLTDADGITRMRMVRMLESSRTFLCSDGRQFMSLLLRPTGENTVEAAFLETTRLLMHTPANAGERLTNSDISIWTVGGAATLEMSGHRYDCHEIAGA